METRIEKPLVARLEEIEMIGTVKKIGRHFFLPCMFCFVNTDYAVFWKKFCFLFLEFMDT